MKIYFFTDSKNESINGEIIVINTVLQFPPNESSKILVNFIKIDFSIKKY